MAARRGRARLGPPPLPPSSSRTWTTTAWPGARRNLGEWRAHLLERLGRQVALTGDPALAALLEELAAGAGPGAAAAGRPAEGEIAVPLRLRTSRGDLAFISTVTTFGTAVEVPASELSIVSFFPADPATAAALGPR